MEILDIVDEMGNPTGETVERSTAHRDGIPHRTAHVWLVRRREENVEILLQKRSADKDSFPGCYDISSAGHIPAGVDYIPSAIREIAEELGLFVKPEELVYCGYRMIKTDQIFYGQPFHDRQYSRIYLCWKDVEPEQMKLQKEEIESVVWMEMEMCMEKVCTNQIDHCIIPEELEMVRQQCKL